jgi:hypothetical protein
MSSWTSLISSRAPRPGAISDLIAQIDAHIASQQEGRPTTAGTMFVDFDAAGEMQVKYRNRRDSFSTFSTASSSASVTTLAPPPPTLPLALPPPQDKVVPPIRSTSIRKEKMHLYEDKDGKLYVKGYDPASRFQYDYDGAVVHLHREARGRPASAHSDYYHVDAEAWSPRRQLIPKASEDDLVIERKKRHRAVEFVQNLLRKMDAFGYLGTLRERRQMEKMRAKMKKRRGVSIVGECAPQIPPLALGRSSIAE